MPKTIFIKLHYYTMAIGYLNSKVSDWVLVMSSSSRILLFRFFIYGRDGGVYNTLYFSHETCHLILQWFMLNVSGSLLLLFYRYFWYRHTTVLLLYAGATVFQKCKTLSVCIKFSMWTFWNSNIIQWGSIFPWYGMIGVVLQSITIHIKKLRKIYICMFFCLTDNFSMCCVWFIVYFFIFEKLFNYNIK